MGTFTGRQKGRVVGNLNYQRGGVHAQDEHRATSQRFVTSKVKRQELGEPEIDRQQ